VSTSVLNQAVSSATNFALALVPVRMLSAADYGSCCLGIAVCYLYAGLGNSMLLLQMVVHTPGKPQQERLPYAVRILVAVGLFAVGTLVLTRACFEHDINGILLEWESRYLDLGQNP